MLSAQFREEIVLEALNTKTAAFVDVSAGRAALAQNLYLMPSVTRRSLMNQLRITRELYEPLSASGYPLVKVLLISSSRFLKSSEIDRFSLGRYEAPKSSCPR